MQVTLGNKPASFTQLSNQPKQKISRLQNWLTTKTLLIVIATLQVIMILLIVNPVALWQQFQNNLLIGEVARKVQISTSEAPIIATVVNADELRNANGAQAQIYKDAQVGDYVIGYTNRLIIYRRQTGTIIYDGATPTGLVTEAQKKITDSIIAKAKSRGLISSSSTEVPQISIITDVDTLKKNDENFYANAKNNDIVGLFAQAQVIVLYNQENDSIVSSGKYNTAIQQF